MSKIAEFPKRKKYKETNTETYQFQAKCALLMLHLLEMRNRSNKYHRFVYSSSDDV